MESDDSGLYHRRKRKSAIGSSSDESDFDVAPSTSNRRRKNLNIIESNSDTDSDSSIEVLRKKRSRPSTISDSDSTSSEIVTKKRGNTRIPSDPEESCESDWSVSSLKSFTLSKKVPIIEDDSSSDSDGQSDKCPICLISFKSQEVGSPESCDHSFCRECIQEWSKNVNTCPVDRQPFSLILVRNHYNGRVIRQVQVEPATQQINLDEVIEDPTYCEICGSCDREDRMLLCDGCDLGYHLECLTPPLSDVPTGVWYCTDCGPDEMNQDVTVYLQEVELLYNDVVDMPRPTGPRRRTTTRLVPRTRQTERVRARIITNRTQNRNQRNEIEQQIEVVVRQDVGPSTSRRKKKKKPRKKRKPQIKITYEIDEATGQQIVIETKTRKYTKKRKKKSKARSARIAAKPKTVKKRLAVQLGMCAPRTSGQTLPDVRISSDNSSIGFQRNQAGIPRLHLFGRSGELDYFSDSDVENDGGGVGLLRRRRPNMSDAAIFRRNASRKNILLQSSNTCDLLDSILDSQEKFHSKNTVLSLKKDGTIKIDTNNKPKNNNRNDRINLNDANAASVRQTPMCSNTTSSTNGSVSINNSAEYRNSINTVSSATTTISNNSVSTSSIASDPGESSQNSNYSLQPSCSGDVSVLDIKKSESVASPHSESELDIYSDIETVSTSKAEDEENKALTPVPEAPLSMQSDDEANNSDVDLVIDTEKVEEKVAVPDEEPESKEEAVSSTTNVSPECEERAQKSCDEEDNDSEDGCPNFSIYSAESINLAKTTDLELLHQEANVGSSSADVTEKKPNEQEEPPVLEKSQKSDGLYSDSDEEIVRSSSAIPEKSNFKEKPEKQKKSVDVSGLYSDSDDEIVKVDTQKPFGIGDIRSMTEDISEEERSYTPCLDERAPFGEGLDGLDTEAISDEEKNDFDESHELKTASDGGDALEINAKECELDFTKPEEYEEGEIVDKLRKLEEAKKAENTEAKETTAEEKETENTSKDVAAFKKISKSNKDRNYRDKEKQSSRSPSKDKENDKKRDRKKEKRKEIERYNVRTVLAEKPRRMKDKFGRDRRRSGSRSSRSTSPPYRSPSRGRRSYSREKSRKRRARTHSRSRSRKRSRSRHRRRSASRPRAKRRRSRERSKNRKKNRSLSRQRSRSNSPRRRRDWERRSRGWSPSPTRSRSPLTPSWTPPRVLEKQPVKPHNLTVILTNDSNKKKKDKKKTDKKRKENVEKQKKRKRDKTPPPSKEVFASGDNILVSVSFNDEREREATVKRKRDDEVTTKRTRKEKARKDRSPRQRKRKSHDLSGIKPVAIIDLDRSPFKELTPSPKDVIVLSDSENGETREDNACATNQQPDSYPTGPKTPPEPQVKFSLNAKPAQLRAISNPLHEPDDMDGEMDPQEELEQRLNESLHKGPNTPPEPPNSPPSSPDAYDPFDPTKSRSPTPEIATVQSTTAQSTDINRDESSETMDKSALPRAQTPDISHTPPVVPDVQPADSQSNASINTPDTNSKQTPERSIGVVINQVVQSQASIFPAHNKSIVQPSYSSASLVTSTPISGNLAAPRINILNSTILAPATVMSSVPQRIVLPTTTKSSPIKVSPTKPPIKSTPIKPMPNKNISKAKVPMRKSNSRSNNDTNDSPMALDSPYSPGPSDYEDLFEPPSEPTKLSKSKSQSNNKSGNKAQGSFDALFGSSPIQKFKSTMKSMDNKKKKGTKLVGVKVDEDSLKILDDVPNSAVEMQVKDKFLKKLNRQERVVEEVKLVLKPHYNKKHINKDEYKDILRRAVPKICHNKSGEINPKKIQNLIEAYVKKIRHSKKVTSSSSVNPQK